MSFKIKKGDRIGIIGNIGSGKSTILNLISRLYDIKKGNLYIDGIDVKKFDINTLRNSISYVPQDSFLFSDTIIENIKFGNEKSSVEDVVKYTSIVEIHEEIKKFNINCEVIDELAREVNMQNEVAKITESAMRGELDFGESLHQRLSLLKGAPSSILSKVLDAIDYNPGAKRLIAKLQSLGYKTAIISGGFSFFTEHIKNSLSIDYAFANVLEISNGILTGNIENCPLDGKMKNSLMKKLAVDLNIDLRRVIAVGDGANDIPMISNSGLGIAFRAKPKVSEASKYAIKIGGLDTILYFLGIKDD